MRVRWLPLLALLATLACSHSGPRASAAFGSGLPAVPAGPGIQKLEHEMFQRLNRDRKEHGLPPLKYDERLADVARFHATDMRDHKFFEHHSPNSGSLDDRLNRAGYLFLTALENLAEAPDVQTAEDSLLQSPGHFANIMSREVSHIGIGVVRGGVHVAENLTVTQVFAMPGRAESPAAARDALIARIQGERASRGRGRAQLHPLLNDLAASHIAELDAGTTPGSLKAVAERVSAEVAATKGSTLRGVTAAGQLLPDSRSFQVPERLASALTAPFGLAVRKVPGAGGRPMLQLLLLIGL